MNSSIHHEHDVLFREVSRPPRWLTWPIVLLAAGALATPPGFQLMQGAPYSLYLLGVSCVALALVFLLELPAVLIEVHRTEIRVSLAFLYRRRIPITEIRHLAVRADSGTIPAPKVWRYTYNPLKREVEITMNDGSMFTIVSIHAQRLADAIAGAREMAAEGDAHRSQR